MVRYENYWRKDQAGQQQPYLDKLEMIYGMDRSAMQGAFAAGELDMIPLTTWPEVESFTRQVQGAQVFSYPAHWSHGLTINFGREPFSDKRVRQAVDMLIDRPQIIETVMFGKGVISLPVVPAVRESAGMPEKEILTLPGFRPDKTADIAEAKKLLAEAGYGPGGKKLSFELLYTKTWAIAPAIEFIATQLKQYDIDVNLRGVDSATFSKDRRDGKFDASLWHLASPDPFNRPLQNWDTRSPDAKGAGMPDLGQNKIFDELRATTDVARQNELLLQLQKLAVSEVFGFVISDPVFFAVAQPWVNEYRPSLSVQPEVTGSSNQLWLDQSKLPAKRK
jgi:ABC-type transport system substrate-binding protein